jgi:hypothetical protein
MINLNITSFKEVSGGLKKIHSIFETPKNIFNIFGGLKKNVSFF